MEGHDNEMELNIGLLLRTGLFISAFIVLFGGIIYLTEKGALKPDYKKFVGEPQNLKVIKFVIADALKLNSSSIMQMGILLLIATPIARVMYSIAEFAKQRDYLYVCITVIVLAIIAYSLFGGVSG
jgi:uncharacterized membrane protein